MHLRAEVQRHETSLLITLHRDLINIHQLQLYSFAPILSRQAILFSSLSLNYSHDQVEIHGGQGKRIQINNNLKKKFNLSIHPSIYLLHIIHSQTLGRF